MAYKALDIANKIISKTDLEHGDTISNLKLQKMMYYRQGFHLAYFGTPLFDEDIVAWQYGPVVPSVYKESNHLNQTLYLLQKKAYLYQMMKKNFSTMFMRNTISFLPWLL